MEMYVGLNTKINKNNYFWRLIAMLFMLSITNGCNNSDLNETDTINGRIISLGMKKDAAIAILKECDIDWWNEDITIEGVSFKNKPIKIWYPIKKDELGSFYTIVFKEDKVEKIVLYNKDNIIINDQINEMLICE